MVLALQKSCYSAKNIKSIIRCVLNNNYVTLDNIFYDHLKYFNYFSFRWINGSIHDHMMKHIKIVLTLDIEWIFHGIHDDNDNIIN